ncbi:MAG: hypothetical protein EOL95_08710 [Bacteroidia bacterium]|nr:hypothetical protein [Bacteroidia bacterium]
MNPFQEAFSVCVRNDAGLSVLRIYWWDGSLPCNWGSRPNMTDNGDGWWCYDIGNAKHFKVSGSDDSFQSSEVYNSSGFVDAYFILSSDKQLTQTTPPIPTGLYISADIPNKISPSTTVTLTANNASSSCDWSYSDDGTYWTPYLGAVSGPNSTIITPNPSSNTYYRVTSGAESATYQILIETMAFAITGGVNGTPAWHTIPSAADMFQADELGRMVMSFIYNSGQQFKILAKDGGVVDTDWGWGSEITVTNGTNISGGTGNLQINNFANGDAVTLILTKTGGSYTLSAEAGMLLSIQADLPNPITQGDDLHLTAIGADSQCTWEYSQDGVQWETYTGETSGVNNEIIAPKPMIGTYYKVSSDGKSAVYRVEVLIVCSSDKTQTHLSVDFGVLPTATARTATSGDGIINTSVYNYSPEGKEIQDGWYAIVTNPLYGGRGTNTSTWVDGVCTVVGDVNATGDYWYNDITDHTGQTNGGMLMVNCKNKGELVYSYTKSGLCKNMYMTFSAWFANAAIESSTMPINTQFRVLDKNGMEIVTARINVDGIKSSDGWRQGTTAFFSGDNDQLTVQIINNGESGLGNDILIDDIEFTSCVPQLSIQPGMVVQCGLNTTISVETEGIEVVFDGAPYYLWQKYNYSTTKWDDIPDDPISGVSSHNGSGVGKIFYEYATQYEPINKPKFRVVMSSDPAVAHQVGADIFPVCLNYAITEEVLVDCGCAPQTISLVTGDAEQSICAGTSIIPIVYMSSGSKTTGVGASDLPAGLQLETSGTSGQLKGQINTPGDYIVKIFAVGIEGEACESDTLEAVIHVSAGPTLILKEGESSQSMCSGEAIEEIVFEYGGTATGVQVSDLPSGLNYNIVGKEISITGSTTSTGTYSISTTGQLPSCDPASLGGTITIYENPGLPNIVF